VRVALASDHAGWPLRDHLLQEIIRLGHEVVPVGPKECEPGDDYPDRAVEIAEAIISGDADRGVLVCGSGVGASVAANKIRGLRAGLCHDSFSARQGVEDDDMNLLCLGARVIGTELASDLLRVFLAAKFSGLERHRRRVGKIRDLESEHFLP
jgi:ribose 5-phosphate isomerase B